MTMTAARKSGPAGMITCMAPDVCKTPVGSAVVPIPYMITSMLDWAVRTEPTVKLTELEAFTMNSRTDKVVGDEPGTLGGVKSGVNKGWCRPISQHFNVQVGGYELIQNNNLYDMNCAGPEGPGNTIGRLVYYE
ncbi:DUF4150 domain-containing protein [Aliiroseovarius sp.]|uniref:DUF4150 domain-containing protein n=1 Tax=Aliiroseovarius sp. TaxID=1872442 RepID=UPI003BA88135